MSLTSVSFSTKRWICLFWLHVLFLERTSCHELEGGILPHFQVDHQAGKLKITASRDSADISYQNDNVDMVVKPNNKEQAKLIINSMRDNGVPTKSDISVPSVVEETGQSRGGPPASSSEQITSSKQLHMDPTDDIGLRRSRINKHYEEDTEPGDAKNSDGVTWRGRINHVTEESPPDSKHVLSALSEIKNLMTLSMKPPNLKAFDAALPLTTDKYLTTASTVIKKLENAQDKKRMHEETQDNGYLHKVKAMIHDNLRNNTYSDDPSDYAYVQKAHAIIANENRRSKECPGGNCRPHLTERSHKSCTGPHCRHNIYFMTKPEMMESESQYEEYTGKPKDRPTSYHSSTEYDNDYPISHHKAHNHHPYDATEYHSNHISPYHSQGEEYPATVYGDEVHHSPLEADDVHGAHNRHIHDNNDRIFEKDFENKINQKEYGDDGMLGAGSHHAHHVSPHHGEDQKEYADDADLLGDHRPRPHQSSDLYHDSGYLGAGDPHNHEYQHEGFHPHGGAPEYDMSSYHHGGEMADLPEHQHSSPPHELIDLPEHHHGSPPHELIDLPEHHHGSPPHEYGVENDEAEGHNREHHNHPEYDFDESKEIKDEEHDNPQMLDMNGKLKDWYKINALGIAPSAKLDEPMDGDIVLAANQKAKEEQEEKEKASKNSTKVSDKKIERKFEQAGEKPLNSTETEEAINKLNESLANGLNESTIKAISSFDNGTDLAESNKTAAKALNSFNTIKFESMNKDDINPDNATDLNASNKTTGDTMNSFNDIKLETLNNDSLTIQKMLEDDESADSHNGTQNIKTADLSSDLMSIMNANNDTHADNQTNEHKEMELKKKISTIEKKINSSGDLMKKLEELEKKMNTSDKNLKKHDQTLSVANTKKQLSNAEKMMLRVNPQDILQASLADEEYAIVKHALHNNGTQRTLNTSAILDSIKNDTKEDESIKNDTKSELIKTDTLNELVKDDAKNESMKNDTKQSSAAESSNVNDGGSGASIENVYASIGEPGDQSNYQGNAVTSQQHNASSVNTTKAEPAAPLSQLEDKHQEQKNPNVKEIENYWQKLHKTKVHDTDVEKFALLKRHKTKGYHKRRGSNGFKRHKTNEHSGSKRHKTKERL